MANTLKDVAKDNKSFELDEQREDIEAGRVTGAQLPDNPQNGAYVVPIFKNQSKDTIASGTITGGYVFHVEVACENKSCNMKNCVITLQF